MEYEIYIPSYGRAGNVTTTNLLPDAKVVIPKSQFKDYKKHHSKKNIVVIPDNQDGSISMKRNAILNVADVDQFIMLDDDLKKIIFIEDREEIKTEDFYCHCDIAFELCNDIGSKYWGLNWDAQPLHFRNGKPFSKNKPFWAVLGVIKSGLYFDEKLNRGEDMDFWLQHMKRDGCTLRVNYLNAMFRQKDKKQAGGISAKADPIDDIRYLRRKWPGGIIRKDENGELKLPLTRYPDF